MDDIHEDEIFNVAFSEDGTKMMTCSADCKLTIFKMPEAEKVD